MMDFPQVVAGYLAYLERRSSYRRVEQIVRQWIGRLPACPTRQEILARHQRRQQGLPTVGHYTALAQSANKELSVLRSLLRWGIYEGHWTGSNPTDGIRKWKTPRRRRVMNYQEVSRFLHNMAFAGSGPLSDHHAKPDELSPRMRARMAVSERRDRAIFGLMMFSGCRPLEGCRVKIGEITPYGAMGRWMKPATKNGQVHEIPLPRQAMDWLASYSPPSSGYLFPGANGGPITSRAIHKRWLKWRAELRFDGLFDGLWMYDFRRTLATYLITVLKEDSVTVQAILNHYDGRAIGHYSHHTFDTLAPIVQHYADWLCSHMREEGGRDQRITTVPVVQSGDCVRANGPSLSV